MTRSLSVPASSLRFSCLTERVVLVFSLQFQDETCFTRSACAGEGCLEGDMCNEIRSMRLGHARRHGQRERGRRRERRREVEVEAVRADFRKLQDNVGLLRPPAGIRRRL